MSSLPATKRIDAGVPRGRRIKPSDLERRARDEAGKFLTSYTPEVKQRALEAALIALEAGARVDDVAQQHGIPCSTMYSWLIGDPRAETLRTQFFDGQAARNLWEIRHSKSPLELACAREELSGWVKVAERRDSKAWGQRLAVESTQKFDAKDVELLTSAQELLTLFKSRQEKVIQGADCAVAALEEKP